MQRLTHFGVIASLLIANSTAFGSADSIGPNGINSSSITLSGNGVDIGQVELRRSGDPGTGKDETASMVNSTVDPEDVFYRQGGGNFAPNYNLVNEVEGHAVRVAGVMISTDALAQGVSQDADLFSAGINPTGAANLEQVYQWSAETINHLATLSGQDSSGQPINIRAINLSFGVTIDPGVADGSNTLSSYLDWSSRLHDVLYVVAGSEGTTPYGVPDDLYNGITVVFSEKDGSKYRKVSADNVLTADDTLDNGDRTFPDIMAPGQDVLLADGNNSFTSMFNGTSYAAPHVTGTAALLHEHAAMQIQNVGGQRWTDPNAHRHEVIKAVLMNSADKIEEGSINSHNGIAIPPGGLLGMERTRCKHRESRSVTIDVGNRLRFTQYF